MKTKFMAGLMAGLILLSCVGCGQKEPTAADENATAVADTETVYVDAVEMLADGLEAEAAAIAGTLEAAVPDILEPEASGVLVEDNGKATIDYSKFSKKSVRRSEVTESVTMVLPG